MEILNIAEFKIILNSVYRKNWVIRELVFLNCYPAGIYLFKVNNRNTRTGCVICSKLKIKTSERRH